MERRRSTAMWALFFLALTIIVCARCEEEGNSTTSLVQHNVTSFASQDEQRNDKTNNDVGVNDKGKGRIGGGGVGMGGGGGWGWGWGGGGGGGGWWRWGCGKSQGTHTYRTGGGRRQAHKKRAFNKEAYKIGEFAQCMGSGKCGGMRLDCPLHCGGPCFYDCTRMCRAHCRR